jgi:serine/threonine-protein kinase
MLAAMACPDENALLRFSLGELPGGQRELLESHLDDCSSCRGALAAVALGSTGLVAERGAPLEEGARLGRYRVERPVGRGAMGAVYAARDLDLDRPVALKVLHPPRLEHADADVRARILHEARAMARLSHPNVVSVYEVGEAPGQTPFIAMELVDGATVDGWLSAAPRSREEILRVFREAGEALAAAHRAGLVHGDFKPQNVLVAADGRARVTDFGLSRHALAALDGEPQPTGTPAYMAPEQMDGAVTPAGDQFAFCVSLYQALTGRRPFEGRGLAELRAAIQRGLPMRGPAGFPSALHAALRRGLSADPSQRFADLPALLAALQARTSWRSQWRRIGLAAAALAIAVLGLGLWHAWAHPKPPTFNGVLTLKPGEHREMTLPEMNRLAVGDPSVADVKVTGPDTVEIIAAHPGRTGLHMWSQDGTVRHYQVRVAQTR